MAAKMPQRPPRGFVSGLRAERRGARAQTARSRAAPGRPQSLCRCEPAAGEAGALEALPNVRVVAHYAPDEIAAVILDHGENRSLIDADVVLIHPRSGLRLTGLPRGRRGARGEARVEGVEEAVGGI